jgi:hypothetical protein
VKEEEGGMKRRQQKYGYKGREPGGSNLIKKQEWQGFMPVILATQEAEIRRIAVQSQPQAISS